MKMKTNKDLTMAAAALMMAACSSEDVPQVDSVQVLMAILTLVSSI